MFKLMHKKLNKKGFTLAELLIVVAIVAILVAIAVPIFTNSLTKAQVATNEANVRSTKAAAVSLILDNWSTKGYAATGTYTATNGAKDGAIAVPKQNMTGHGWIAFGLVNTKGDLEEVQVTLATIANANRFRQTLGGKMVYSGIIYGHAVGKELTDKPTVPSMPSTNANIRFDNDSGSIGPDYWTIVYIPPASISGKD